MKPLRTMLGVATIVATLVACSGGGAAASVSPPPETDVTVSAQGNAFEPKDVSVPSGAPFQLFFRNLDGVPPSASSTMATLVPPSSMAKTSRPPRTSTKY